MQRNPHSYQIATGYRTFYSLSLIYQPITKKRLFFHKKLVVLRKLKNTTMKHILGLDLGTNSIGWAVINAIKEENTQKEQLIGINTAGSRIIPMDAAQLGDFNKGNTVSQTANRTQFRGVRRLYERKKLRRERLHRILQLLGFLPKHYASQLDRYGKFIANSEPKLAWTTNTHEPSYFIFQSSFQEMLNDFLQNNNQVKKVPYDWTLFYLRKKALTQKIEKEELAWILLNFNQKRGYYQLQRVKKIPH